MQYLFDAPLASRLAAVDEVHNLEIARHLVRELLRVEARLIVEVYRGCVLQQLALLVHRAVVTRCSSASSANIKNKGFQVER